MGTVSGFILLILWCSTAAQQNFQRLPQFTQVTKVVMGSSALRVCIW